jgi:hypothetical protein
VIDLDFEWVRGFRFGLWYHDFTESDQAAWNLCTVLDLGFFGLRLWTDLKEEYREEDDEDDFA